MNYEAKWAQLLPRLEADLLARERNASVSSDAAAWEQAERIVRAHLEVLLRIYPRLTPDDGEDIVQDLLLKLQEPSTMRRLHHAGSTAGYVSVMLRNAAIDQLRRGQRYVQYPVKDEDAISQKGVEGSQNLQTQEVAFLRPALERLSHSERELIHLRFWQDMSISDLAGHLGITYSAAAVRVFRALRKLREKLEPK